LLGVEAGQGQGCEQGWKERAQELHFQFGPGAIGMAWKW
jgi:hypothetical protein